MRSKTRSISGAVAACLAGWALCAGGAAAPARGQPAPAKGNQPARGAADFPAPAGARGRDEAGDAGRPIAAPKADGSPAGRNERAIGGGAKPVHGPAARGDVPSVSAWLARVGKALWPMPSPEEWAEVSAFMREHSPRRFAAFHRLRDDSGIKRNVKHHIFKRYKELAELRKREPKVYPERLKQIAVEDEIFGLATRLNAGSDGERSQAGAALQEKVGELVDLGFQERRLRIERLEKQLTDQKAALDKAQARRDEVIQSRTRRILKGAAEWHRRGRDWTRGRGRDRGHGPRREAGGDGPKINVVPAPEVPPTSTPEADTRNQ